MNIHYKIVSKNENEHSFIARYWTAVLTEDFLATEFDANDQIVRLEDGAPTHCRSDVNITLYKENATQQEIDELVRQNAPISWLEILEKVQNPNIDTSMNKVNQEIGVVKTFEPVPPEQTFADLNEVLTQYSIEN